MTAKTEPTPLPAWVDRDAWDGYVHMRRTIKKPLTPRAEKLCIAKLYGLHDQGVDVNAALDTSTLNCWVGVHRADEEVAPAAPAGPAMVPCPYSDIVRVYHDTLSDWPRVSLIDRGRQQAMRARWVWIFSSRKPDGSTRAVDAAGALKWLGDYFRRASRNDFLSTSAAGDGWRPDLDYLLSDKGLRQVVEKTRAA